MAGLHLGPGGDHDNVETYLRQLDAARVPFSIKDVNEWGPELELAAKLRAASGVDHTIIWRHTDTDVPPYHLAPSAAAVQHWSLVKSKMPPGLMPYKEQVWLEVVNEPDMNQCAWMANFSIAVSKLAVSDGWRLFNFGWSTGNPHVGAGGGPDCYEDPATLDFLRYASEQGGKVGVALHEYSNSMNITNEWPYLLGRLHFLFDACDKHDIPRPLAAITEWGWLGCNVKLPAQAGVADIDQVMRGMGAGSYHAFAPQLKAAMMWYLGPWSCPISTQADQLVLPIMNYTLSTYTP
jgi:hypothetical protein